MDKKIAYVVSTIGEGFYELVDKGSLHSPFDDSNCFIAARSIEENMSEEDIDEDGGKPLFIYKNSNHFFLAKSQIINIEIINCAAMMSDELAKIISMNKKTNEKKNKIKELRSAFSN